MVPFGSNNVLVNAVKFSKNAVEFFVKYKRSVNIVYLKP